MSTQAALYLLAIVIIAIGALPISTRGFSFALFGAAVALLAYSWPLLTA
jgi:cytochrome b561